MAFRKSIRFKVSLFIFLLLAAAAFVFYLVTIQIMNRHVLDEILRRAVSLSQNVSVSAGYSMLSKDLLGLDNIAFRIKKANPDIEYIAIVGSDRKTLVHSDLGKSGAVFVPAKGPTFRKYENDVTVKEVADGKSFEVESPIVFMGKRLGAVALGINKSTLTQARGSAQRRIMIAFTAILCIGVIGSLVLSTFLTRPIKELSAGVSEMKEGKRSRPLMVYSRDELGELTLSFNEMTALITEQQGKLHEYAGSLEESYISTIKVIAATLDARDPYTHGHSTRVSLLSRQLGGKMGMSREDLDDLEVACLFHDIGKIRLPDAILRKEGLLSSTEYREMIRHTEYGADILRKAPSLHKYIPSVLHHHERFDGGGYPVGLGGDAIPLFAAIISVADAYDAMTSDRPYRKAFSAKEAAERIMTDSGKQFHPDLVALFLENIENFRTPEEYREKSELL